MNLKVSLLNTKYTYSSYLIYINLEKPGHSDKDQISGFLGKEEA